MSSLLDHPQIIKQAFDDASSSLKVNITSAAATNLNVNSSYQIGYASINGSAGAVYQIVASTSAVISKIIPNEQTGIALSFYTGAAASEVELFIIAPGQDNEVNVNIPAGTRLSIRAKNATAPSVGNVYLTMIG